MIPGFELSSATPLRGPSGRVGLLGALMFNNESGGAVAITAAQLGAPTKDGVNLVTEEGCVSSPSAATITQKTSSILSAAAMLLNAPIERDLQISRDVAVPLSVDYGGGYVRDPSRWLGCEVEIVGLEGVSRPVRLVSVQGIFAMPWPGEKHDTEFVQALELTRVSNSPVLQPGEVGALVRLTTGELLGVVIAGTRDVAFAAPIAPLASARKLCAFSADKLRDYNRRRGPTSKRSEQPIPVTQELSEDRLSAIMESEAHVERTDEDRERMKDVYLNFDRMVGGG